MAAKRKRGIAQSVTSTSARKRTRVQKNDLSSPTPHDQIEGEPVYRARSIIDENKTYYKIDWEDDPITGERYDPTWEPKANANQALRDDWHQQKKSKRKRDSNSPEGTCFVYSADSQFLQK
ncbi:uncharacterized protein K489DRAFT_394553 [Dissoconium aciculare CBS 342.82]|uniref:Chromo domain-containing protein n=1 Tax=Dissoconium aciculare CBS 342.82 TaxID=1314786 RepID=A0A6J3M4C1_9PEZI|nr:uncharacterized protein K489DRAFT_394553 [Dissoconium aciculare CBS 342.82]KAF1822881.1 hypothetical protein K489DRAFT_394553 [Dissoconium aciculare CBS 342.82]